MKKQCCVICRKPLNDGIMINGRRICKSCEERLIKAEVNTDFYEYYKKRIRRSIAHFLLKGEERDCPNYHL
ncbi:inhibitor of sigma-G Gin [Clostridium tepidiprofundi DSM 19306]|uniref:Inhibitor of sigma-G Gin n=1 Tax=Clostridium tepidiprofundi DSM 19306 TaxID=1121338 RepID=A0A151AWV0_9CLOT|nr:sigma factor G inhibitor Gin [Clostridium tepidiprofundi]KYH31897.1 inhibitor of sigma-G Gin [Clostridium tepidiprofundi DSM 19306]